MERKRIKCGHVLPTYAMRNTSRTTLVVKDTTYGNFLLTTIIGVIYCLMVSATMVHSGKTKILIERWRIIYLIMYDGLILLKCYMYTLKWLQNTKHIKSNMHVVLRNNTNSFIRVLTLRHDVSHKTNFRETFNLRN